MKKLILLCALFAVVTANAQLVNKEYETTVQSVSATPVYITLSDIPGLNSLVINGLCTQDGGTSEGTIILQARTNDDAAWVTLNSTLNGTYAVPTLLFDVNDTVTISSGAVFTYVVTTTYWNDYRLKVTGGASDTTTVDIGYQIKK